MSKKTEPQEMNKFDLVESLHTELITLSEEEIKERKEAISEAISGKTAEISEETRKVLATIEEEENIDSLPETFKVAIQECINASVVVETENNKKLVKEAAKKALAKKQQEIEEEAQAKVTKEVEALTNGIDTFLSEAVNEWLKDNKLAAETGLRTAVLENFFRNIVGSIKESNLDADIDPTIAEELDTLREEKDALAAEFDKVTEANTALVEENAKVKSKAKAFVRAQIISEETASLSSISTEKVKRLVAEIPFKGIEDYRTKIKSIVAEHAETQTVTEPDLKLDEPVVEENTQDDKSASETTDKEVLAENAYSRYSMNPLDI